MYNGKKINQSCGSNPSGPDLPFRNIPDPDYRQAFRKSDLAATLQGNLKIQIQMTPIFPNGAGSGSTPLVSIVKLSRAKQGALLLMTFPKDRSRTPH